MKTEEKKNQMERTLKMIMKKTGFTLIELLVVISAISLLMAMLLPALSSARDTAKSVGCMSNLRQMSLAVEMYTNNSNGYYPPAWVICDGYSVTWCGRYYKEDGVKYLDVTGGPLWPYLQDKKIMRCKTFSLSQPKVKFAGSGEILGYGINCQYVAGDPVVDLDDGAWGMTSYARPARVNQIKRPGETVLFADSAKVKNGALEEEIFVYPRFDHEGGENNKAIHYRHRGRANTVFCDGHADRLAPELVENVPIGENRCYWFPNRFMDRN